MLSVGSKLAYGTFGPGEVTGHVVREHQGVPTTFAVMFFPHGAMTVQVPIESEAVAARTRPIIDATEARRVLRRPAKVASLARAYEDREKVCRELLSVSEPASWSAVIWAYVSFVERGGVLAVSDREMVNDAIGQLSCEAGYALGRPAGKVAEELWKHMDVTPRKRGRPRKADAGK